MVHQDSFWNPHPSRLSSSLWSSFHDGSSDYSQTRCPLSLDIVVFVTPLVHWILITYNLWLFLPGWIILARVDCPMRTWYQTEKWLPMMHRSFFLEPVDLIPYMAKRSCGHAYVKDLEIVRSSSFIRLGLM